MKDIEKIKSEDLAAQVQDANPGKNFGEWFRQNKALERVKSQGFYVPDDDENPANQGGNGGNNPDDGTLG